MKNIIKKLLPNSLIDKIQLSRSIKDWAKRDYLENSPQLIKQKVFEKYGGS